MLKRMEEVIQAGLYDLPRQRKGSIFIGVFVPEFSNKQMEWVCAGNTSVPAEILHYDDTDDTSNTFITSWKNFYIQQSALSTAEVYRGSTRLFKDQKPRFSGIAKAAEYLRYSLGFRNWLRTFDSTQAAILDAEEEVRREKNEEWAKNSKIDNDGWPLVQICQLTNGKRIVVFLEDGLEISKYGELAKLDIDVEHSLELVRFFKDPSNSTINSFYQIKTGLGRNPFNAGIDDNAPRSEYLRLMGIRTETKKDLTVMSNSIPKYKLEFSPNPEASCLYFLPEGDLKFSELSSVIEEENQKKKSYLESRKEKKTARQNDESEKECVRSSDLIPAAGSATVMLVNVEITSEHRHDHLIVQEVFPSVSLEYFRKLNKMLMDSRLKEDLVEYMKIALSGQTQKGSASVYQYWTKIFSAALRKQKINAFEVYWKFQSYAKMQKGEILIEKRSANRYCSLIGKLLRLQYLITADTATPNFIEESRQIQQFEIKPTEGVFGPMINQEFDVAAVFGKNWELLRDDEKTKITTFANLANCIVPGNEREIFLHGALIGILLNKLTYTVQQTGRHFSATQGCQPTRLRGVVLTNLFTKGISLLKMQDQENRFNGQLNGFIKSVEQESFRNTFNNGLILGLTFYLNEKNTKTAKTETNEVSL